MTSNRKNKLRRDIQIELGAIAPNVDNILSLIYAYEKDNLDTIHKLNRKKTLEIRKINGAIKQFLHVHPVLTRNLIGSLSKRIYGGLLQERQSIGKRILKYFKL